MVYSWHFHEILARLGGLGRFIEVYGGLQPFKQLLLSVIYQFSTMIIFWGAQNAQIPSHIIRSIAEVKNQLSEWSKCSFQGTFGVQRWFIAVYSGFYGFSIFASCSATKNDQTYFLVYVLNTSMSRYVGRNSFTPLPLLGFPNNLVHLSIFFFFEFSHDHETFF